MTGAGVAHDRHRLQSGAGLGEVLRRVADAQGAPGGPWQEMCHADNRVSHWLTDPLLKAPAPSPEPAPEPVTGMDVTPHFQPEAGGGEPARRLRALVSARGGDGGGAGSVVFLDAIADGKVRLEVDVITPHVGEYYRGAYYQVRTGPTAGGDGTPAPGPRDPSSGTPPADWLQPCPVEFLTVGPGTPFLTADLPRRPNGPDAARDVETAVGWLIETAETAGFGAKTALGYGLCTAERV